MTTYQIWNQRESVWLREIAVDPENGSRICPRWCQDRQWPAALSINQAIAFAQLLGSHDLVIVPTQGRTCEWYVRGLPILARTFSAEQQELLQQNLHPLWNGLGNCSWFLDFRGRSHGPISSHELGGWTIPQSNDRYESIFEAAATMVPEAIVEH
ncbi:MAG: hypothetical protein AAGB19_04655 [Cyanobacteria bacterium P01_F01_bin.3]